MKKFTKAIIITSCVIFALGVVLAITSLALGANPKVVGSRLNTMGLSDVYFWGRDHFYNQPTDYNYDYGYDYDDYVFDNNHSSPQEPNVIPPKTPELPTPGEYEITSLYFDFEAGDINITQGDDFALIYGNSRAQRYFYENREGSTWTISSRNNWNIFNFWHHGGDNIKLTVVLPEDFVAERMDIFMGAGNMHATALRATEINMDVGLGNCQIGELLAEDADLSVGMGRLEVRNFHATEAWLDVGMGEMELRLAQPLADYKCDVNVGLGNAVLGNNSYSGVANANTGSADSLYQMQVNCAMGSIAIKENF